MLNVERHNEQFRQPNPNGRYPVCVPIVGDPQSHCERCGNVVRGDIPCVVVPREQRWASRLTLEIVNVRVERLQEISEADCVEEGVQVPVTTEGCPSGKARILTQLTGPGPHGAFAPCTYLPRDDDSLTAYSRAHFASGWDALNAKRGYSWKSNPRVWVVEFRKT